MIRTRSPLSPGRSPGLARLACMRRAASVRPEPGSNSPSRPRITRKEPGSPRSESRLRRPPVPSGNCVPPRRVWCDTELTCGCRRRSRSANGARTGFRLSLLCFQETALRPPPKRRRITDTRPRNRWSEALRARRARASQKRYKNVGVNRLRSSGPVRAGAIRRAGRGTTLVRPPRRVKPPPARGPARNGASPPGRPGRRSRRPTAPGPRPRAGRRSSPRPP